MSEREPWMDAGHKAYEAWVRVRDARSLGDQADAVVDLSNAMSDLVSFLPEWDWEHGVLNAVSAPEEGTGATPTLESGQERP